MRFPRTLCERKLREALAALKASRPQEALQATTAARQAFDKMKIDMGDDVPTTAGEMEDFAGHIAYCTGSALFRLGQLRESSGFLQSALSHFERTQNPAIAATLRMLGVVLRGLGQGEEALKCYRRAVAISQTQGDERELHMIEHNAGNLCCELRRGQEALDWYTMAKEGYQRLNLPAKEADVEQGIGATLMQMGNLQGASQAYQRARSLLEGTGSVGQIAGVDLSIGSAELFQGRFDHAITYFERARSALRGQAEWMDLYLKAVECLANACEKSGRHAEPED